MRILKQIMGSFAFVCIIGTWLWFFITQFPVMLTRGWPDTAFALAFIALSAVVLGTLAVNKIKGILKQKEVPQ